MGEPRAHLDLAQTDRLRAVGPRRDRASPGHAEALVPGPRPDGSARRCSRCWSAPRVLYLWNLSASGYANEFYAAAVQAGTQSWKAWLFGSLDSGNAITVDKPPGGAVGDDGLSARIFGFSSWSLLVPQALMGVGVGRPAVRGRAPLGGPGRRAARRRRAGADPAAVLMFRFDNPDALLVLLLVAGAYATVRAIDAAVGARVDLVAGRRGRGRRLRVPHEDGPGAAGRARRSGWRTWWPGRPGCAPGSLQLLRRARRDGRRRRAGTSRWSSCGPPTRPALHRRLDDQLAAGAGAGLQRSGPHPRRERQRRRWRRRLGRATPRSAARPGSRGCSPARSPGDVLAAARGVGAAGRRARRSRMRRAADRPAACGAAAVGRLDAGHRRWCSAS